MEKVKKYTFKRGDKVIFIPENKVYDFGYMGQTGMAIIYEEGESNMQDSCAVDLDKLKPANETENMEFTHDKLPDLFEHIRKGKAYYIEHKYIVTNEGGSDIAEIAFLGIGEWRFEIDNYPMKRKHYHTNFPINTAEEFMCEAKRIGLELKLKK